MNKLTKAQIKKASTLANNLWMAIHWYNTKEGDKYWSRIADKLERLARTGK